MYEVTLWSDDMSEGTMCKEVESDFRSKEESDSRSHAAGLVWICYCNQHLRREFQNPFSAQ